jgi:hypothetical protein
MFIKYDRNNLLHFWRRAEKVYRSNFLRRNKQRKMGRAQQLAPSLWKRMTPPQHPSRAFHQGLAQQNMPGSPEYVEVLYCRFKIVKLARM